MGAPDDAAPVEDGEHGDVCSGKVRKGEARPPSPASEKTTVVSRSKMILVEPAGANNS